MHEVQPGRVLLQRTDRSIGIDDGDYTGVGVLACMALLQGGSRRIVEGAGPVVEPDVKGGLLAAVRKGLDMGGHRGGRLGPLAQVDVVVEALPTEEGA